MEEAAPAGCHWFYIGEGVDMEEYLHCAQRCAWRNHGVHRVVPAGVGGPEAEEVGMEEWCWSDDEVSRHVEKSKSSGLPAGAM